MQAHRRCLQGICVSGGVSGAVCHGIFMCRSFRQRTADRQGRGGNSGYRKTLQRKECDSRRRGACKTQFQTVQLCRHHIGQRGRMRHSAEVIPSGLQRILRDPVVCPWSRDTAYGDRLRRVSLHPCTGPDIPHRRAYVLCRDMRRPVDSPAPIHITLPQRSGDSA